LFTPPVPPLIFSLIGRIFSRIRNAIRCYTSISLILNSQLVSSIYSTPSVIHILSQQQLYYVALFSYLEHLFEFYVMSLVLIRQPAIKMCVDTAYVPFFSLPVRRCTVVCCRSIHSVFARVFCCKLSAIGIVWRVGTVSTIRHHVGEVLANSQISLVS
jgi:hypothetical protein